MPIAGSNSNPDRKDWINFFWRKPATTLAESTRRRVSLHLIPYLFFLYILAYLDRVNVSVAQLGMMKSPEEGGLGFDLDTIGFGAGIFFWGYWILEIPSTVSVTRWGARWVFVRILILWGICAALVGAIGTPFASSLFSWMPHVPEHSAFQDGVDGVINKVWSWFVTASDPAATWQVASGFGRFLNGLRDTPTYQFYLFRFMLGFFEGGFFPSVIFYLSIWFRAEDRAKAIASFMAAIPLSSMIGVPLSGLLLDVHWLDLPGWRWIYILEGIAPVLAGIATIFFLPDRPATAPWLSTEEKNWLIGELEAEHKTKQAHGHGAWKQHLGIVLLLTVVYFCLNLTSYGLSMFMPAILKSQTGATALGASFLSAIFYCVALVAMLMNGWHSDRRGERIWHVAVPLTLLSLFVGLTATLDGVGILPVVLMLFFVAPFMYAHLPAFWPIPTMFLGATAAASAIGFINMIGNLGGSVGPMVVGKVAQGQTTFAPALLRLAPWPVIAAGIILVVGYARRSPSMPRSQR